MQAPRLTDSSGGLAAGGVLGNPEMTDHHVTEKIGLARESYSFCLPMAFRRAAGAPSRPLPRHP